MATAAFRPSFPFRNGSIASSGTSINSMASAASSHRNVYAKDGQGYDFAVSYPYVSTQASSSSEALAPPREEVIRARYAKDGKGHDFSGAYQNQPCRMTAPPIPAVTARYAKDGKGFRFEKTYQGRN